MTQKKKVHLLPHQRKLNFLFWSFAMLAIFIQEITTGTKLIQ